MNKSIYYSLLVLTLLFGSCREDDTTAVEKRCADIDSHLKDLKAKELQMTQSGKITGYYKGKDLVMTSVATFGDMGRKVCNYYFEGDKLQCVVLHEFTYNKPIYYNEEMARRNNDTVWFNEKKTTEKLTQNYFYHEKMVKWRDSESKLIPDNDRRWDNQSNTLLTDGDKLLRMFKE
jgi:hypothetical protein